MGSTIESTLVAFRNALRVIATSGDCSYYDSSDKPDPCDCTVCTAKLALEGDEGGEWRFRGRGVERLVTRGREAEMVDSWRRVLGRDPDRTLGLIVGTERDDLTPRDWYVATSVVQWLATSIGQNVLEGAGYLHRTHGIPESILADDKLIEDVMIAVDASHIANHISQERADAIKRHVRSIFTHLRLEASRKR